MNDWIRDALERAAARYDKNIAEAIEAIADVFDQGRAYTLRMGGITVCFGADELLIGPKGLSLVNRNIQIRFDPHLRLSERHPAHFGLDDTMLYYGRAVCFQHGIDGAFGMIARDAVARDGIRAAIKTALDDMTAPELMLRTLTSLDTAFERTRLHFDGQTLRIDDLIDADIDRIDAVITGENLTMEVDGRLIHIAES